jgi:hypothetical protein
MACFFHDGSSGKDYNERDNREYGGIPIMVIGHGDFELFFAGILNKEEAVLNGQPL